MDSLTVIQLIKREVKSWPDGEEFLMVTANIEPVDFSDITKKRRKNFSIVGVNTSFRMDLEEGINALDWQSSKISRDEWELV